MQDLNKGYRHPFLFGTHYLGGVGDNPRTLVEIAMSQFSAELRRQQGWWKNYKDESFRAQWRKLTNLPTVAIVKTPSATAQVTLSDKQIEYTIDELVGYAALRDEVNNCQVSCFERIWESSSLLSTHVSASLLESLSSLSTLPTCTHSSDGSTHILIDPMLHSLIYHRTLISHKHQQSRPLPPPPPALNLYADIYTVSRRFALLPSDVFISPTGDVSFLSYINNLHPEDHSSLYNLLTLILSKLIPLFEHTLTDLHRNNPLPQRIPGPSKYTIWDEPEPPEHSDDEESWITYERDMRHWVMHRPIQLPDVPAEGYQGGLEKRNFTVSLKGKRAQVIVEAVDMQLSPGGPGFAGTPWHVKGMRNERIVACGMQCLIADNITTPAIEFRMAVSYPRGFSAGDTGATLRTWGLRDGDACHQYIGHAFLKSGFSIVFPNIYQHRILPFELDSAHSDDKGSTDANNDHRGGRLLLLMFYLVDPDIQPVVSTSVVAPQQRDWIWRAVKESLHPRLPMELVYAIFSHVEGLVSIAEAEEYRLAFVGVQKSFTQANNNYHFCVPFDIWNGPGILHSG